MFLVSVRDGFSEFVEFFAVVELDLGPASKNVLKLGHDTLLYL